MPRAAGAAEELDDTLVVDGGDPPPIALKPRRLRELQRLYEAAEKRGDIQLLLVVLELAAREVASPT